MNKQETKSEMKVEWHWESDGVGAVATFACDVFKKAHAA